MIQLKRKPVQHTSLHQAEHTVNQQIFQIHSHLETLDKLQNVFKNFPNPTVQRAIEQSKTKIQQQITKMINQGIDPINILSEFGGKLFENEVIKSNEELKAREMQPSKDNDIVDPINDEKILNDKNKKLTDQVLSGQQQNRQANAYYERLQEDYNHLQEHERQKAMEILVHNRYRPRKHKEQVKHRPARFEHGDLVDISEPLNDTQLLDVNRTQLPDYLPEPEPFEQFYERIGRSVDEQDAKLRQKQFKYESKQYAIEQDRQEQEPNYFRHILDQYERQKGKYSPHEPLSHGPLQILTSHIGSRIETEESKGSPVLSQKSSARSQIKPETQQKLEELKQKVEDVKAKQLSNPQGSAVEDVKQTRKRTKSTKKRAVEDLEKEAETLVFDQRKTGYKKKIAFSNLNLKDTVDELRRQLVKKGANEKDIERALVKFAEKKGQYI